MQPDHPIPYAQYVIIGLISALLFGWILNLAPGLFGVDGYFHIRYSKEIWEHGISDTFPWLVNTIYSQNYANDHLLLHILQIPFTFGNLITGAKVYGIVVATLSALLFFAILERHHIPYAWVWTLAMLVASAPFLVRVCMARAPGISLCTLLIATYLILAHKDRWFIVLCFFYVWLYGAFPLIGAMSVCAFISSLSTNKKRPQIVLYCGLGIILGLIIHPYFPNNITFLFKSYTQIEFADVVTAGNEDYPYASSTVVRNAMLAWILVFIAITMYLITPQKLTPQTLFLFLFSTVLLCLYMNVRRFVEYWPPMAILFAAFALSPYLQATKDHLNTRLGKPIAVLVALLLIASGWDTLTHVQEYRAGNVLPEEYSGAATYLRENTPQSAIVFTGDWDDFPLLFHFNTHNRYVVGLDPHYLYYQDATLYDLWYDITMGNETLPIAKIKEHFQAQYIFSLKSEKKFLNNLKTDPSLSTPVYEDTYAVVYKL